MLNCIVRMEPKGNPPGNHGSAVRQWSANMKWFRFLANATTGREAWPQARTEANRLFPTHTVYSVLSEDRDRNAFPDQEPWTKKK